MDTQEVRERLKKDLGIPRFEGKLAEKEYTEEEYQTLKNDLIQYFEDYVRNVEN